MPSERHFAFAMQLHFFLFLASLFASTFCQGAHLIWQGFDHHWERNLADFSTPHRLGAFANYIETVAGSDESINASGTANLTFTPGVDGDYAFPTLFVGGFSDVSDGAGYIGSKMDAGNVVGVDADLIRHVQDNASSSPEPLTNPVGLIYIDERVLIPVPDSLSQVVSMGDLNYAVVLRGLRIDMHCYTELQPKGGVCNSNGVWPFRLSASVSNCSLQVGDHTSGHGTSSANSVACEVVFRLDRAWTPMHGGGKAFNYVMDYDIQVALTLVAGNASRFSAVVPRQPIVSKGGVHSGPQSGRVRLSGRRGMSLALPAIASFGFELLKTDGFAILGRYIEQLRFDVSLSNYSSSSGNADVLWNAGILSPETVLPSQAQYELAPVLLQFGGPDVAVSANHAVKKEVCFSGFEFNCKSRGMIPRTNVQAPINFMLSARKE